jgi:hypothetical protein
MSRLGVHRISNPAGIPAGFNEFSGIRPDLEKIDHIEREKALS